MRQTTGPLTPRAGLLPSPRRRRQERERVPEGPSLLGAKGAPDLAGAEWAVSSQLEGYAAQPATWGVSIASSQGVISGER